MRTHHARVLFALLIGLSLVAMPLYTLLTTLDLSTTGRTAQVVETRSGHRTRTAVFVDDEGRERSCKGWGLEAGDTVRYDDRRCRGSAYIGLPTPMEWMWLGGGGFLVLIAVAVALHREEEEDVPDPRRPAPPGFPPPPRSVRIQAIPGGVELRLPWRANLSTAGILVGVFFTVAAAVFGTVVWPVLLLAAALGYNTLYNVVNATVVRIDHQGIVISHGPLPAFERGLQLRHAQLRSVVVESVTTSGRHAKQVHGLRAGTHLLLQRWNRPEPLAYVKRCIEQVQAT